MRVEELSSFGKAFDHMPLSGQLLQAKLLLSQLKARFGFWGMLAFLRDVMGKKRALQKEHGITIGRDFATVPRSVIGELYLLASMYYVLGEREDQAAALEFILGIFRSMGPTVHATLYNTTDLLKCEGDVYTNFCRLNRSIFENSAAKGFYDVEEIQESPELQFVRLTRCLNIDLCSVMGCPELAQVGCAIDMGGYAPDAMGDLVQLDFRRPRTLANGDPSCDFHYYRQGHAPAEMETL